MKADMTSAEKNALSIILRMVGEGRSLRTYETFKRAAKKLPNKLIAIHYEVNKRLERLHAMYPRQSNELVICFFRPGDRRPVYKPFYPRLSQETVRKALVKSGLWEIMKTGKIAILEHDAA